MIQTFLSCALQSWCDVSYIIFPMCTTGKIGDVIAGLIEQHDSSVTLLLRLTLS